MNKHKIFTILEIVISILIVMLIGVILINVIKIDTKEEDTTVSTKEMIVQLNELLINGGTKEQIHKLTGIDVKDIDSRSLLTGPDSYMAIHPDDKVIKENSLDNYLQAQEELVKNVEKAIKENFEYTIDSVQKEEDYKVYSISLKSYYQTAYQIDLMNIENYIDAKAPAQDEITRYKHKVAALKILNENLDEYVNKDEFCVAILYEYNNDLENTKKSITAYLNQVQGINYHNEKIFVDNQINSTTRIEALVNNALAKNLIDANYLLV